LFAGACVLWLGVGFFAGVRSWPLMALSVLPWLFVAAFAISASRRRDGETIFKLFLASTVLAATIGSVGMGPFLQLPLTVSMLACGTVMAGRTNARQLMVGGAALAILGASVGAAFGLHPVKVVFDGTGLHISGGAMFWTWRSHVATTALSLLQLFTAVRYFQRHRLARDRAEATNLFQKWQLRQLLPDRADDAMKTPRESRP
jgi:hypothetical protein